MLLLILHKVDDLGPVKLHIKLESVLAVLLGSI